MQIYLDNVFILLKYDNKSNLIFQGCFICTKPYHAKPRKAAAVFGPCAPNWGLKVFSRPEKAFCPPLN